MTSQERATKAWPRVRLVVLNYNGGDYVLRCLRHLERLEWPRDRLELVVVDNDSQDGSDKQIETGFDRVRLIRTGRNLGFPGNNLALQELDSIDYVGLVNNDAFVCSGWLAPLVDTLEGDPGLGAACPKILFDEPVVPLEITAPTFRPAHDARELGVRVSGVRAAGTDLWDEARFLEGFFSFERGPAPELEFRWTGTRAVLGLPIAADAASAGEIELRLAAAGDVVVGLRAGGSETSTAIGREPRWVPVEVVWRPVDVINNAGSRLVARGYGGDRGFQQLDRDQFDKPEEVFAWCGGGVLLRREYLADVGLLDERFFLYYEDTDLSWRGRARGWKFMYVPDAVQRHLHAATSGEWSPLFRHYVERNRLLMLVKNAPSRLAAIEVGRFVAATISYAVRDIVRPLVRLRRPSPGLTWSRVKSIADFLRLLPAMLVDRRRLRHRQTVPDSQLLAWMEPS